MTLPPLLLEMQHPVRNFAAGSAHHIDDGSELPGIIFSVESDGLACSKARTATPIEGLSNGSMVTRVETTSQSGSGFWVKAAPLNSTQLWIQPQ